MFDYDVSNIQERMLHKLNLLRDFVDKIFQQGTIRKNKNSLKQICFRE